MVIKRSLLYSFLVPTMTINASMSQDSFASISQAKRHGNIRLLPVICICLKSWGE